MKKILLVCYCLLHSLVLQANPVEIIFWHGMAGSVGDEINFLAQGFNKSQSSFRIKPVYKGGYIETLTSFAASFRSHKPPDLVQVFEVGSALMLVPAGVIKPVDDLMAEQGLSLPKQDFIRPLRDYYSIQGKLMALPFNSSVPVLYYDKQKLARLGYGANNFPKTWSGMQVLLKRLKAAGNSCGYTSAYPGWVLVESYLALHGIPLMRSNPLRVGFDSPALVKHFKRLKAWQQAHYFQYGGRVDDAMTLFTSGVCPIMSQSSGAYHSLASMVKFPLGLAPMPLDEQVSVQRHANVLGGGALWVIAGQSKQHYRGIAEFLVYLAGVDKQQHWHEHTGYLPLGLKGVYAPLVFQGKGHPTLALAQQDLEANASELVENVLGPKNQMRRVYDEVLEALFAGLISPEEALEEAKSRCDRLLQRYIKNQEGQ